MKYIVSRHANERYRQRVEKCSKVNACDRLQHAGAISRPATELQLKWLRGERAWHPNAVYRYCDVENLLLICKRYEDGRLLIVTVLRCPRDSEIRAERVAARRREKLNRKKQEAVA